MKKNKKNSTKYIVAIIISLIIGTSILGYGYLDYKYKTNRDKQNLEAVSTSIVTPTLEPTNTPTPTPKPTNIPTLKPSPTPTIDPIITTQIKSLEDQINKNNKKIEGLKSWYTSGVDGLDHLSNNQQAFNQMLTTLNGIQNQIQALESQNIELNKQKTELLLKK